MNPTTEWLPRPTVRERMERFQTLRRTPQLRLLTRFSEYLSAQNIVFFHGDETKIEVVEALVKTLPGHDPHAALQAIWSREREGALGIPPDIAIVRGRLEGVHHIRA